MTWSVDHAEASGYTHEELAILYEIADQNDVSPEAILRLIREENSYGCGSPGGIYAARAEQST
jgi:hypothetical protein